MSGPIALQNAHRVYSTTPPWVDGYGPLLSRRSARPSAAYQGRRDASSTADTSSWLLLPAPWP